MSKGTVLIAGAMVMTGAAFGTGLYLGERRAPGSPTTTKGAVAEDEASTELVLRGAVVMDGTTNGCSGENILVEVREGGGNVVSESVTSDFIGLDCAFPFALEVPRLDCYQLVISETIVGEYPRTALESGSAPGELEVGYIDSASVFGEAGSFEADERLDWPYGC